MTNQVLIKKPFYFSLTPLYKCSLSEDFNIAFKQNNGLTEIVYLKCN